MSFLPDEIWIKILEMGATAAQLGFRDLCSLAITCRRLNRLSGDPSLWSIVLSLDFPDLRHRFERDKARRIAAWRRRVLFAESHMALSRKRLEELECQLRFEGERMKEALEELRNLERIRQASVALNVWQPEIVHGRQRQIVEQCTVPIESRRNNLYMEINLCKQQIATYNKNKQKQLVKDNDELLSSLKYRPLDAHHLCESSNENGFKRKKLKSSSNTWASAKYGNMRVTNKKNRVSDYGGSGTSLHTSGSVPLTEHKRRLAEYLRMREQANQSSVGEGSSTGASSQPPDYVLWSRAAGGKKGRIYGLGAQAYAYEAQSSYTFASDYTGQTIHDVLRKQDELLTRINQLESQTSQQDSMRQVMQ